MYPKLKTHGSNKNYYKLNKKLVLVDEDFLRPKMLLCQTPLVRKFELPSHVVFPPEIEVPCMCVSSCLVTHDASLNPLFLHLKKYSRYSLQRVFFPTLVVITSSTSSTCLIGNYFFQSINIPISSFLSPSRNWYRSTMLNIKDISKSLDNFKL